VFYIPGNELPGGAQGCSHHGQDQPPTFAVAGSAENSGGDAVDADVDAFRYSRDAGGADGQVGRQG